MVAEMTDNDLAAIEARCAAATPGPWETHVDYLIAGVNDGSHPGWRPPDSVAPGECTYCSFDGAVLVNTVRAGADGVLAGMEYGATPVGTYHVHRCPSEDWHTICATNGEEIAGNYDYEMGGIKSSEADAIFIAHAREDVPALVAEVRRLREQLNEVFL